MRRVAIQDRYKFVVDYFAQQSPNAETELVYDDPFQLLVAVILSAQCTDKRVNMTTPFLFKKFPNVAALAAATYEEVFELIKSISYPGNKSRHLIAMARMLEAEFGGQVPLDVAQLMRLPGVGRKTANVVTSVIDGQPNMAVDTHVFRVSARIGLTRGAKTPLQAEQQLLKHLPTQIVHQAHHWLILHGRYTCTARRPSCASCGLQTVCSFYQRQQRRSIT